MPIRIVATLAALMLGITVASAQDWPVLPDPVLTPGAVASTDQAEVCGIVDGMTYSQRHRATTAAMKREVFRRYGMAIPQDRGSVEIDHRGPLCAGFADVLENLWPQYGEGEWGFPVKDRLEAFVCLSLCRHHTMSLPQAQAVFLAPDWRVGFCAVFPADARCATH